MKIRKHAYFDTHWENFVGWIATINNVRIPHFDWGDWDHHMRTYTEKRSKCQAR